jgi:ParB family transcriptional regulator, chromosome partitioning protein
MASTTNATQNGNGHATAKVQLKDIPISRIVVTEGFNPRGEVVEDDELQAMAATMRERGCLQPIRVRATESGDFALIAGERRYRAGTLAALTTLPAVVLTGDTSDEDEYLDLLTDVMIENELRSRGSRDPTAAGS